MSLNAVKKALNQRLRDVAGLTASIAYENESVYPSEMPVLEVYCDFGELEQCGKLSGTSMISGSYQISVVVESNDSERFDNEQLDIVNAISGSFRQGESFTYDGQEVHMTGLSNSAARKENQYYIRDIEATFMAFI